MSFPRFARRVLPLLIFPLIPALGIKYIFIPWAQVAGPRFRAACPSEPSASTPNRQAYTSLPAVDARLCSLVTVFEDVLHPASLPFVIDFLLNISPLVVFPFVEAARAGRSALLSMPVLLGMVYQNYTVALTMPLYWTLFLCSRHTNLAPSDAKISHADALALLFAFFVGFLIPSIGMVALNDPYVTAIWQGFPIWFMLAQQLHVNVLQRRSSAAGAKSGYVLTQVLYGICFVLSGIAHLGVVSPRLSNWAALHSLFIPGPPTSAGALGFLQWDFWGVFAGAMLAALWFGRTAGQVLGLVAWQSIATPLLGPGAALAVVYMWREATLSNIEPMSS